MVMIDAQFSLFQTDYTAIVLLALHFLEFILSNAVVLLPLIMRISIPISLVFFRLTKTAIRFSTALITTAFSKVVQWQPLFTSVTPFFFVIKFTLPAHLKPSY